MVASSSWSSCFRYFLSTLSIGIIACVLSSDSVFALPNEDFEQLYFEEAPDRYAKEHSLVYDGALFHLFYVSGNAGQGWGFPGNEIDFGHATSPDLEHWTVHAPVIPIDPANGWKARNVWAPHVSAATLPIGGQAWAYVMAYAGVDSSYNQRIGIAVSNDLFTWHDLSVFAGAYSPDPVWARWDDQMTWSACRDPFLFELGGGFVLNTTALTRSDYMGLGTRGAISLATSSDGLSWIDAGAPMVINNHFTVMASSFLRQDPVSSDWHLFYTRTIAPGGVHYLTSAAPTSGWDIATDVIFDPIAISGDITPAGGIDLYAHAEDFENQAGLAMRAVRFDTLAWPGGAPTFTRSNTLFENWALVGGDLGAQPTYGDRPGFRSGQPSNVEGNFWINTAENYAGLFGGGCATCGADETQTGVLRSRTFQLTRSLMTLRVGGSANTGCFVALVDSTTGMPVRTEFGLGTDVMTERQWEVGSLVGKALWLEIRDQAVGGHIAVDAIAETGDVVAVGEPAVSAPTASGLLVKVAPNPIRARAKIRVELAGSERRQVPVQIYDATGRLIRTLEARRGGSGTYEVEWEARNTSGDLAPTGIYFVRSAVGETTATARVTLVH